jgi:hypothetical protein
VSVSKLFILCLGSVRSFGEQCIPRADLSRGFVLVVGVRKNLGGRGCCRVSLSR